MVTKIGTAGRNILTGTANADILKGLGGNDDLYGFGGNDQLFGGTGNDRLFGGSGNDTLFGGDGNDKLFGGPGDDELIGGNGNDLIRPGLGFDGIDGGPGNDTLDFSDLPNGSPPLNVSFSGGYAAIGPSYTQAIFGVENVIGSNSADDRLEPAKGGFAFGRAGGDTLVSQFGAVLRGDTGLDTLVGDAGFAYADYFWLQPAQGADTIDWFDRGQDKLRIKGSDFGIGAVLNGNEFANAASNAAIFSNPQFIYRTTDDTLWFDRDGTGGTYAPQLIAGFGNGAPGPLNYADFELI